MSVTESADGRASRGGFGAGLLMGCTSTGRSSARAQARYRSPRWRRAVSSALVARHRRKPLHEARGHGRRAGELGRIAQHHLVGAERLREVVGGERDAPLRQIEAERVAHGPVEPRIGARLRRPGALDEPAEHHAVDGLQPRLERAVDAHAHAGQPGPPHHAIAIWRCGTARRSRPGPRRGRAHRGQSRRTRLRARRRRGRRMRRRRRAHRRSAPRPRRGGRPRSPQTGAARGAAFRAAPVPRSAARAMRRPRRAPARSTACADRRDADRTAPCAGTCQARRGSRRAPGRAPRSPPAAAARAAPPFRAPRWRGPAPLRRRRAVPADA